MSSRFAHLEIGQHLAQHGVDPLLHEHLLADRCCELHSSHLRLLAGSSGADGRDWSETDAFAKS